MTTQSEAQSQATTFPPESIRAEVEELLTHYPPERKEASLIPLLLIAQKVYNHISDETAAQVARYLDIPEQRVLGVVTFYTMLFRKPVGENVIWHCKTLSCHLRGARECLDAMREKLGVEPGETTPDGKFTLMVTECLGLCELAPVVLINDDRYVNLTPARVTQALDERGAS